MVELPPTDGPDAPRCKCGYTIDHHFVGPECEYSFWGWILLVFVNAAAVPNKVKLLCRRCETTLWETTDPAFCEKNK